MLRFGEVVFTTPDLLRCLLALIDVRLHNEPTDDAAFRIPHRETMRMEPSVDAIRAPLPELDVVRLTALD
jgi:hypothetical protein